jgi:hypothetical protein
MSAWDLHQSWQKVSTLGPVQEVKGTFPHMSCFQAASKAQDLPLPLLLAVARGESDFNPRVESKANAIGVMQIQWPGTAKDLGIIQKASLYNPCINIDAGARYLKQLINRYNDVNMALAAYNYGPGRIKTTMTWATIPSGARWYSGYIFDHYQYVTRDTNFVYSPTNKLTLATFNEPFRAKAMTAYFHAKYPGISIDWFADKLGRYRVVASFDDDSQRQRYSPMLERLGVL